MEGTTSRSPKVIISLQTPETSGSKTIVKEKDGKKPCGSVSRLTRSQLAPDWSARDALFLVNEIAAVEADCSNAFSTYQKWEMISQNCNAMDVPRSINQCRRKWDSLLVDYKKINKWESLSGNESYWDMGIERKKQCGFADTFDLELFIAIENVVRLQEDREDMESENDSESGIVMFDRMTKLGSKRLKRKVNDPEEKHPKSCNDEDPQKSHAVERLRHEERNKEEFCRKLPGKQIPHRQSADEKKMSIEENKRIMAAELRENANRIHAIISGNLSDKVSHRASNAEDLKTELVRRQGDQLIACLGNIVNTLNQFPDFVRECNN